jgi:hypothetical protein
MALWLASVFGLKARHLVDVFGFLSPQSRSEQDGSDGCQDGDGQKDLCPASSVRHADYPDPPEQCRSKTAQDNQRRSRISARRCQWFEVAAHGHSPGKALYSLLFSRAWIIDFDETH